MNITPNISSYKAAGCYVELLATVNVFLHALHCCMYVDSRLAAISTTPQLLMASFKSWNPTKRAMTSHKRLMKSTEQQLQHQLMVIRSTR